MTSFEEFVGGYRPPTATVRITQRADLLAEHTRLQREHQRALRDDPGIASSGGVEVKARIETLEDEIAATEVEFTFQSMPRHDYMRLRARHRPRPEDRKNNLDFNGDTFPPALVAECCVSMEMTEEQATELCDQVSDGQFAKLWNAAITVNVGDDTAPKSVRHSATAATNGDSSTTAAPEESP